MADDRFDGRLEQELRRLSDAVATPTIDLSVAVLARIVDEPTPARPPAARRWAAAVGETLRRRWRAVVAVLMGGVVAVAAVSPVGATFARWFTFGGVEVVQGPVAPTPTGPTATGPTPTGPTPPMTTGPAGPPADVDDTGDGADVAAVLGVPARIPELLGPPETVEVDRERGVVSMTWPGGVRLEQFRGEPHPLFAKKYAQEIEFVTVHRRDDGLWFAQPHELVYLDADGVEHREGSRTAAATLLWTDGPLTLRLEGAGTLERAVQLARSTG